MAKQILCVDCSEAIPLARLLLFPGAERCALCQGKREPKPPYVRYVGSALAVNGELGGSDPERLPRGPSSALGLLGVALLVFGIALAALAAPAQAADEPLVREVAVSTDTQMERNLRAAIEEMEAILASKGCAEVVGLAGLAVVGERAVVRVAMVCVKWEEL